MPRKYTQESYWHEDGNGFVFVTVILSDKLDGMYSLIDGTQIDCVNLGDIKHSIDDSALGFIQSNLNFEVYNNPLTMQDNKSFIDLLMEATTTTPIYVSIFIENNNDHTLSTISGSLDIANLAFSGRINSEIAIDDIKWRTKEYETTTEAIKSYKFTAKPLVLDVLDKYTLKDLILGNTELGFEVDGIPAVWETANVLPRNAYLHSQVAINQSNLGDIVTQYCDLVNLNALLYILLQNISTTMQKRENVVLNIIVDKVVFDGNYLAMDWEIPVHPRENADQYKEWWKVYHHNYSGGLDSTLYAGTSFDAIHNLYISTNINELTADIDTAEREIYIDYKTVKHKNKFNANITAIGAKHVKDKDELYKVRDYEDNEDNEVFRITRYKTLGEYLQAISYALNAKITGYMASETELHIKFIPSSAVQVSANTYLKDAIKSDTKFAPLKNETREYKSYITSHEETRIYYDKIYPFLTIYCGYGIAVSTESPLWLVQRNYATEARASAAESRKTKNKLSKENKIYDLAFTMSPSVIKEDDGVPINTLIASVVENLPQTIGNYRCFHTGIYIRVKQKTPTPTARFDGEFFSPVHCRQIYSTGAVKTYYLFEELLDETINEQIKLIQLERNITVPYIHGFSNNADGTNNDWKCINLGSVIDIDGTNYEVKSITRTLGKSETKITLKGILSAKTNPNVPMIPTVNPITYEDNASEYTSKKYRTAEAIPAGIVVAINENGLLIKAKSIKEHYGKIIGISKTNADADNYCNVITAGTALIPNAFFTIGNKYYLRYSRYATAATSNIGEALPTKTDDEDLHLEIGTAIDRSRLRIENIKEYILW